VERDECAAANQVKLFYLIGHARSIAVSPSSFQEHEPYGRIMQHSGYHREQAVSARACNDNLLIGARSNVASPPSDGDRGYAVGTSAAEITADGLNNRRTWGG